MKIQDLEKISEYFDGECNKTEEIAELLSSDPQSKTVYDNFKIVSKFIKEDSTNYLNSVEAEVEDCWAKIDERLTQEDQQLDQLLQSTFILPPEVAEIDLWESINKKLDEVSQEEIPLDTSNLQQKHAVIANYPIKAKDWELLLTESFKLPNELAEKDIWENISAQIDGFYHAEMFSESTAQNADLKEKFIIGLSEYFDGEVSAEKAQIINNHLIECASCRGYYLNLVKLKNALKQSLALPEEFIQENFWHSLENTFFPEENNNSLYKRG